MKIIKQGNIPEYNFTCRMCGCEFIAGFNECECYQIKSYDYDLIYLTLTVECPCCNAKVKQMITQK